MNAYDITELGLLEAKTPETYVMEYQVESERGFQILGSTIYSSNTLLPLDPNHFTSIEGQPLGNDLLDFQVPDDSWVWAWSQWCVDMTADVDDQGWSYSWRFRSKTWSGRHHVLRSFVRQRIWKRPRAKRKLVADTNLDKVPTKPSDNKEKEVEDRAQNIIGHFAKLRNDREKSEAIIDYIMSHPEDIALLANIREQILATLSFPVSKRSLINRLTESESEICQTFLLAPTTEWRDQVLRNGEPEEDPGADKKSLAGSDINEV